MRMYNSNQVYTCLLPHLSDELQGLSCGSEALAMWIGRPLSISPTWQQQVRQEDQEGNSDGQGNTYPPEV